MGCPDLDQLRREGDPLADAVVQSVHAEGPAAIRALNAYTRGLCRNDELPGGCPAVLEAFLESTASVGTAAAGWDEAQVRAGADLPLHYPVPVALLLQLATMPLLYAARQGVEVLGFTGRLQREPVRRSVETAQMVFDVNRRGGLGPSGLGRRSTQRVRLMHASVRQLILASGRWDPALGTPINQEDLLGTLYSFSVLVVDGLERLGADLPAAEAAAFYERWRAVGELLGIRPEIIAPDLEQARADFEAIQLRQFGTSDLGEALIRTWIRENHKSVHGLVSEQAIGTVMRHLVGPRAADCLDLPGSDRPGLFARAQRRVFHRVDRSFARGSRRRRLSDELGTAFIQRWFLAERGPHRPGFAVLEVLRDRREELRRSALG